MVKEKNIGCEEDGGDSSCLLRYCEAYAANDVAMSVGTVDNGGGIQMCVCVTESQSHSDPPPFRATLLKSAKSSTMCGSLLQAPVYNLFATPSPVAQNDSSCPIYLKSFFLPPAETPHRYLGAA